MTFYHRNPAEVDNLIYNAIPNVAFETSDVTMLYHMICISSVFRPVYLEQLYTLALQANGESSAALQYAIANDNARTLELVLD